MLTTTRTNHENTHVAMIKVKPLHTGRSDSLHIANRVESRLYQFDYLAPMRLARAGRCQWRLGSRPEQRCMPRYLPAVHYHDRVVRSRLG